MKLMHYLPIENEHFQIVACICRLSYFVFCHYTCKLSYAVSTTERGCRKVWNITFLSTGTHKKYNQMIISSINEVENIYMSYLWSEMLKKQQITSYMR